MKLKFTTSISGIKLKVVHLILRFYQNLRRVTSPFRTILRLRPKHNHCNPTTRRACSTLYFYLVIKTLNDEDLSEHQIALHSTDGSHPSSLRLLTAPLINCTCQWNTQYLSKTQFRIITVIMLDRRCQNIATLRSPHACRPGP